MNRILKILAIVVLTLAGFASKSQNTEWSIVSSTVTFKIKNAGFTVDGKLGAVTGKIVFDAAKSYSNNIDVSIDSKSLNTNNSSRDGHLKKKEYFDVQTYPLINMKANLFGKEKDGTFKGYFKLSLKNTTKDLVIPFSFIETAGKATFKGIFTINRLDYGIGESSMILSDNTTITIQVNVVKK